MVTFFAIPDGVHRSAQEFLAAIWKAATDSATAGLQAAQAGWDVERADAEMARFQLAAAFDRQTDELQALQSACGAMEEKARAHAGELARMTDKFNALLLEAKAAEASAAASEAAALESRKRAEDLREQLNLAHGRTDQAQRELSDHLRSAGAAMARPRGEISGDSEKLAELREAAARLQGELQAVQAHNRALLATFGHESASDMPSKGKRSKNHSSESQQAALMLEAEHVVKSDGGQQKSFKKDQAESRKI